MKADFGSAEDDRCGGVTLTEQGVGEYLDELARILSFGALGLSDR
jgi:hypothetical protein